MTAHELAKKLLSLPDVPVTVRGYEGGVDIINHVSPPDNLALNVYEEWYYGKHEYVVHEWESEELKGKEKVQAIHISGGE